MNKLLIIANIWPEPDSTAAGSRMLQLIGLFREKGYQVIFMSTAAKNLNSYPLEDLDIQAYTIELNHSSFDELLIEIKPDIVLFDRYLTEEQFGWRVVENAPDSIRILDTEDLHFLRRARQEAFHRNDKISLKYLVNDITRRELASIYRCDLSLIISKYEYDFLVNTFKIDKSILLYIPFLLNKLSLSDLRKYPGYVERCNFMTIGNFKHKPNSNAVIYLKNTIWQMIRKELPQVKLYVYGAYITDDIKKLHSEKDGFIIEGRVKSKEYAFANSRICLAPLLFGAGLKGKLLEAMQYGTPSITTGIGAEGMHGDLEWNGFISDEPVDFAKKAIELYSDKDLWDECQINGVKIINHQFTKGKYESTFFSVLHRIQHNLKDHRLQNLTGEILMHHTLQSTKYMSKWIEEKNKK